MTPVTSSSVYRKSLFDLPESIIYLDGNSLGPLPKSVSARVRDMIENEWGQLLIRSWNEAGWMEQPARLGDLLAPLIGAPAGCVMLGDTLTIKLYQALSSALEMRPGRKIVLTDSGNFPADLYMAQGLIDTLDRGHEIKIVAPDEIEQAIDEQVAVVMLTEVDYRSGRKHEMKPMTESVQDAGAVMIWDLAHSAGALPVELVESNCEFAIGCTYKYLNGGPGAPGFIYLRQDIISQSRPALPGWMGHADPFVFDTDYRPAASIERMRVGTPPIIQMAALEEALKLWQDIDMRQVRETSIELSQCFITEVERRCPELRLLSPRDPEQRGSQVAFGFEHGYAVMQALIARGVVGDFRAPDIMRFGIAPLYLDQNDMVEAAKILHDVLQRQSWRDPAYLATRRVT